MYYFIDIENSETETTEGCPHIEDEISDSCSDEEDATFTSDRNGSNTSDEGNVIKNALPLFQHSEFKATLLALRQRHNIANIALDNCAIVLT